jgi:2-polyprenyl-3-methyl-5-hydroxy-6-metoxy-1,4-benzoquinol methylase
MDDPRADLNRIQSVAHAYDLIADDYDAQLESSPLAREMRRQLHTHLARLFRPGDRVLDLTAGTGIDACFLAARGVHVSALDISSRMIMDLQERAKNLRVQVDAQVLDAQDLAEFDAKDFDGAISTFAGLNTVEDVPKLARALREKVKPRGRILIHALNSFCLWEAVAAKLQGRPPRGQPQDLRVGARYISHARFDPYELWQSSFAPAFRLNMVYAMSVIAAPVLVDRFPRLAPMLFALDRLMGRAFPKAGDFFVMELER